ncbi:hypothetical protein GCM10027396_20950 [Insolitispirillum peregrinum]
MRSILAHRNLADVHLNNLVLEIAPPSLSPGTSVFPTSGSKMRGILATTATECIREMRFSPPEKRQSALIRNGQPVQVGNPPGKRRTKSAFPLLALPTGTGGKRGRIAMVRP